MPGHSSIIFRTVNNGGNISSSPPQKEKHLKSSRDRRREDINYLAMNKEKGQGHT